MDSVKYQVAEVESSEGFYYPSFALIFLCLFTIANYFSPKYFLGGTFSRVPFIMALLAAIFYVLRRMVRFEPILKINAVSISLFCVFLFSVNASYFSTIDAASSQDLLSDYAKAVVLFFLIGNILDSPKAFKWYLVILVLCSFGLSYRFVHYPIWSHGRAALVGSSLSNDPNGLSAIFVYSLPIVVALFMTTKNTLVRLGLSYVVFMLFLGIIEGQSRGGFLALVVSCVVLVTQVKSNKHRIYTILILLTILPIAFLRFAPPKYIDRIMTIFHTEADSTGSADARASSMSIAFDYTISHPFSEYGLGNHSYHIAREYGADLLDQSMFRGSLLVHNMFLQYGADTGLIPLTFYIFFSFILFVYLSQSEKVFAKSDDPTAKEMILYTKAIKISYCGYMAAAFFLPWAYDFFLYYLGGLILAIKILSQKFEVNP